MRLILRELYVDIIVAIVLIYLLLVREYSKRCIASSFSFLEHIINVIDDFWSRVVILCLVYVYILFFKGDGGKFHPIIDRQTATRHAEVEKTSNR